MVQKALRENGIERDANLMLVGHSFGADTVGDLAANQHFNELYNVTHVVAAAYDSVPQLADIDPSIDVLVLENTNDIAVNVEALNRRLSSADERVSVITFAHEVRQFDGGHEGHGHHQKNYIEYIDGTSDTELDRYLSSIAETGYGTSGEVIAIDITVDEELLKQW